MDASSINTLFMSWNQLYQVLTNHTCHIITVTLLNFLDIQMGKRYLYKRHNVYWVRVPDLVKEIVGKTELSQKPL